jgi:hypothetical protein
MTARIKRGGFQVALGGRGFLTLGGRDFIVTLRVGGLNITLGRDFILTLTSGDDDADEDEEDDEDEEELESLRFNM